MRRSREQVIWDFVQSWLRKAEADLRAAERLLEVEQEDHFAAAFHAQQAAEKSLKAFLVRHQIAFRKTHDIQELLELTARADPSLKMALSSAATLTPFGAEFRYPGEEVADFKAAREALHEAKRVQAAVSQSLKDYLTRGRPCAPGS